LKIGGYCAANPHSGFRACVAVGFQPMAIKSNTAHVMLERI
jgi:hypothetical protein